MKLLPKKMTFQLTPLLDLLLIVIFAQFIEVQQTSSKSEASLQTRATEMRDTLLSQAHDYKAKLDAAHRQRMIEAESRRAKYEEAYKSIVDQQTKSGEVLAQIFDVPEPTVNNLLKIDPQQKAYSNRQTQEIRRTLKELQDDNGRELLKMLISYGEMKKRCDIWEIHITEDGTIEFDNNQSVKQIRAKTQQEIEDGLFEAYKTFAEPKTLVILLFSYGDATRGMRTRSQEALPNLLTRMREDTGGRHWFEFAVLGFTPEGPSLRARNK